MSEEKAVTEAAGERLGVGPRDRPAIFREVATAAVENGLPYWAVLLLSGGIATLGLALNSAAVVIGAMLVAPLLAPVLGLALALAVGDARLATQAGAIILVSLALVVATSAALSATLPFHSLTPEISSRLRPSILDLAIGVLSGVVAAVVTVARGDRISAAIPGVAVAVALIPPLAVAGFGIGSGWRGDLIGGSLLLFAANFAGIVLSALLVFVLVGMQRAAVVSYARKWHEHHAGSGLAAWIVRRPFVRSLRVFGSPLSRVLLAVGFVLLLGVPLTRTLRQITREARVRRAVQDSEQEFEIPGRASVVSRQIAFGRDEIRVYLRVATARWFSRAEQSRFERSASALAAEPVHLVLEQMPSSAGEVEAVARMLGAAAAVSAPPPTAPRRPSDLLGDALAQASRAVAGLPFPAGAHPVAIALQGAGGEADSLIIAYAAAEPLAPQAAEVLSRDAVAALADDRIRIGMRWIGLPAAPFAVRPDSTAPLQVLADAMRRYPSLRADLLFPTTNDTTGVAAAVAAVRAAGVDSARIRTRAGGAEVRLQLRPLTGG